MSQQGLSRLKSGDFRLQLYDIVDNLFSNKKFCMVSQTLDPIDPYE
ncbi:hypothetical protein ACFQO9_17850 [Chryseobacterium zhengzhouense]|uniref:Transposase n=1 Tax=Chryseobacterium zhengzhouense TaxID=1636086 RepID=A0ABW2M192_9FLAO